MERRESIRNILWRNERGGGNWSSEIICVLFLDQTQNQCSTTKLCRNFLNYGTHNDFAENDIYSLLLPPRLFIFRTVISVEKSSVFDCKEHGVRNTWISLFISGSISSDSPRTNLSSFSPQSPAIFNFSMHHFMLVTPAQHPFIGGHYAALQKSCWSWATHRNDL